MIRRRMLLTSCAVLPLAACSGKTVGISQTPSSRTSETEKVGVVTVYAPGALAAHTKKLKAAFEKDGLGTVVFEVGHTPVQREQLLKGAKPEVWLTANKADVDTVQQQNKVTNVTALSQTKLVVVVAPGNPAGVKSIDDLAKPGVKVLLAVDTLPIWKATAKTVAKVEKKTPGFTAKLLANTVSREMGVQPIVQKVGMGVADAGIVFVTDVTEASKVETVTIGDDLNTPLPLFAARVADGANERGATMFLDFITTGAGHQVLMDAGYTPMK